MRSNSKIKQINDLMKADKNISVKEICEKTGMPKTRVYALRHYLKTRGKKKLTPVNKSEVKVPRKKPTDAIKSLEIDLAEMQRLAMYWKQAYHELEVKTRGNVAVIQYLESKIQQLFK
jgi:hypothetical protein